jgi:N-acetylglucosamine-6-phosphate deacetylase
MKYFKGAEIITEKQVLKGYVLGVGDTFSVLEPEDRFLAQRERFPVGDGEIVDAEGLLIAPGLIDVHIHGSGGKDTMEGTTEALTTISGAVAQNGVTAFLATTMTMSREAILKALNSIRAGLEMEMPGAQLLGAHMEGPFISEQFKGAQDSKYIQLPSWDMVEPFKDIIKIVTLAPEQPGAKELIGKLKEHGIIASIGHTTATYEQAMEGIAAGASHCTHLFNAMTGIHHRNAGNAVAALSSDIYCELIADKIHVHPGLFELIRKAKGTERVTLITDCIEAGGMPDGIYSLGGQPVIVKDGEARLENGTLAGSVLRLNRGISNFYQNTKAELHEVFRMASLNQATELGIDDRKGSIEVGKDADFFLMDREFNVKATYVKGKCVYSAAGGPIGN